MRCSPPLPPMKLVLLLLPMVAADPEPGVTSLTAALMATYDKRVRPAEAAACNVSAPPGPEQVRTQLYVSKIHSINQLKASISVDGFFRLWWTDARLAFEGHPLKGCTTGIEFDGSGGGASSGLWVPDLYWVNGMKTDVGKLNEGSQMSVGPDGSIFWSRRARIEFSCPMTFTKMPFDHQHCKIELGTYRDTTRSVNLTWRPDRAALAGVVSSLPTDFGEWTLKSFTSRSYVDAYSTGDYPVCEATLNFDRSPTWAMVLYCMVGMSLVLMAYSGFWINPAAVPARVALGMLAVVVVAGNLSAAMRIIPPSTKTNWLIEFLVGSFFFNFVAFVCVGIGNYGIRTQSYLVAKRKEIEAAIQRHSTRRKSGGLSESEFEEEAMKEKAKAPPLWMVLVAKLANVDYHMRYTFIIAYAIFVAVMFGNNDAGGE